MIFDIWDDEKLMKLVSCGLFTDKELDKIHEVLQYLYREEQKFNEFFNTLTQRQAFELECDGKLFPKAHPFFPKFWFDDRRHEQIIAFMQLSDIGLKICDGDSEDGVDACYAFSPYENGELRVEVINLKEME